MPVEFEVINDQASPPRRVHGQATREAGEHQPADARAGQPLRRRHHACRRPSPSPASCRPENIDVSLDLLGETVDDLAESAIATKAYIEAVRAIAENRLGATVSVKLSQLGIAVDPTVCAGHLDDLLQAATEVGVRVEIDMEHSSVGPAELEAFRAALREHPGTRVAIQAAMRRTPSDLESFTDVKPRIRLVKGAFLEPIEKALQERQEITAQYRYLADWALANLPDPAFGTHDDACIDHVKARPTGSASVAATSSSRCSTGCAATSSAGSPTRATASASTCPTARSGTRT